MRILALAALLLLALPAMADDERPDDMIVQQISAERWVISATARVMVNVEAAVSAAGVAKARTDMQAAVTQLAPKAEWRLINFNRGTDNTGLERWSAQYEVRLPENELGGIGDKAKAASKAGMQLSVLQIDFSPELSELEAARAALRLTLLQEAARELAAINAAMAPRVYRIQLVDFIGDAVSYQKAMMRGGAEMMAMASDAMSVSSSPSMEVAQRLSQSVRVVFATNPPPRAVAP